MHDLPKGASNLSSQEALSSSNSPAKILIVDDEEVLCESLRRVLQREGFEVDCVFTSEDAMRLIREKCYQVMITDIIMPDMSGLQLVKQSKKYNPHLIAIIITAYASIDTAVEAVKAGASEYLVKPFQHEELIAAIRKSFAEKPVRPLAH